jgi:hypothetical protein
MAHVTAIPPAARRPSVRVAPSFGFASRSYIRGFSRCPCSLLALSPFAARRPSVRVALYRCSLLALSLFAARSIAVRFAKWGDA